MDKIREKVLDRKNVDQLLIWSLQFKTGGDYDFYTMINKVITGANYKEPPYGTEGGSAVVVAKVYKSESPGIKIHVVADDGSEDFNRRIREALRQLTTGSHITIIGHGDDQNKKLVGSKVKRSVGEISQIILSGVSGELKMGSVKDPLPISFYACFAGSFIAGDLLKLLHDACLYTVIKAASTEVPRLGGVAAAEELYHSGSPDVKKYIFYIETKFSSFNITDTIDDPEMNVGPIEQAATHGMVIALSGSYIDNISKLNDKNLAAANSSNVNKLLNNFDPFVYYIKGGNGGNYQVVYRKSHKKDDIESMPFVYNYGDRNVVINNEAVDVNRAFQYLEDKYGLLPIDKSLEPVDKDHPTWIPDIHHHRAFVDADRETASKLLKDNTYLLRPGSGTAPANESVFVVSGKRNGKIEHAEIFKRAMTVYFKVRSNTKFKTIDQLINGSTGFAGLVPISRVQTGGYYDKYLKYKKKYLAAKI